MSLAEEGVQLKKDNQRKIRWLSSVPKLGWREHLARRPKATVLYDARL
jgi:hypothetical protein